MADERWQLDGDAPGLYQRYLVPAVTAMWADDLADHARLCSAERVLDVACGTGVVARAAAARVGPSGRVDAFDVNPGMLAVARSLPSGDGAPIVWHEASALDVPFSNETFDVAMCQLGLQFFSDRLIALYEMRRVLVPDGRLVLSVFGPLSHNPAPRALSNALDRYVGPGTSEIKRGEHALGDIDELRTLVESAGWRDVSVITATKTVTFPSVADYIRIQLVATPLAGSVGREAPEDAKRRESAIIADVAAELAPYDRADELRFPQEVHTVIARA
jgi:ubiquinone/menaquinone biosynthesis C-methylase UbiE